MGFLTGVLAAAVFAAVLFFSVFVIVDLPAFAGPLTDLLLLALGVILALGDFFAVLLAVRVTAADLFSERVEGFAPDLAVFTLFLALALVVWLLTGFLTVFLAACLLPDLAAGFIAALFLFVADDLVAALRGDLDLLCDDDVLAARDFAAAFFTLTALTVAFFVTGVFFFFTAGLRDGARPDTARPAFLRAAFFTAFFATVLRAVLAMSWSSTY